MPTLLHTSEHTFLAYVKFKNTHFTHKGPTKIHVLSVLSSCFSTSRSVTFSILRLLGKVLKNDTPGMYTLRVSFHVVMGNVVRYAKWSGNQSHETVHKSVLPLQGLPPVSSLKVVPIDGANDTKLFAQRVNVIVMHMKEYAEIKSTTSTTVNRISFLKQ